MKKLRTVVDLGKNIWRIVLTGGPCGAKTSGLAYVRSKLADRGYKVIISPESATKLILSGVLPGPNELDGGEFQEEILFDTLEQEERMTSSALRYRDKGRKVVILHDRGAMDGQAYAGEAAFRGLLQANGLSPHAICNARYHAVMHLQTAAIGAERFYTLANNAARTETPEHARELDGRILEAWQRHPHPRMIDNSTDLEGKLRRLFAEICAVLGDPIPLEREDKFLVDPSTSVDLPIPFHESRITQDYLTPPDMREEYRVRAREDADGTSFYFCHKRYVAPGDRVENERMIAYDEYESFLRLKEFQTETVKKRRLCFFFKGQFFEFDIFEAPEKHKGLMLLEAERTDRTPKLELPPFIKVIRNVTGEKEFSNWEIARRK